MICHSVLDMESIVYALWEAVRNGLFQPPGPQSWGWLRTWGTPPNPRQGLVPAPSFSRYFYRAPTGHRRPCLVQVSLAHLFVIPAELVLVGTGSGNPAVGRVERSETRRQEVSCTSLDRVALFVKPFLRHHTSEPWPRIAVCSKAPGYRGPVLDLRQIS